MKKMTRFSRSFVATAVEYNIADEEKIRHYDILKDKENGLSAGQIANKHGISRRHVFRVLEKYR